MDIEIPTTAERQFIAGVIGYGFTLNADWPNELGDAPESLIGRNAKCDERLFIVTGCEQIGPGIHHYEMEPVDDAAAA